MMERVLLAGGIGRDAAIAHKLAEQGESELHIVAQHKNPSLIVAAEQTGGEFYLVDDICNGKTLSDIADESRVGLVWINQDDALANDVIGKIRRCNPGILSASPDKEGARIEFDKFDSREIVAEIDAEYGTNFNPEYYIARSFSDLDWQIDALRAQGKNAVIKPRGLTGGRGVKVMGKHLDSYEDAVSYGYEVIQNPRQGGLVVEEEMNGVEFTVQAPTDGKSLIMPPFTYDYPYREDGDIGPGTGGMGCFTIAPGDKPLPFLTDKDRQQATWLMERVLEKLEDRGRDYKGILYGSFFKTPDGLKVVEFNARIGCPEGMNIMELQEDNVSLLNLLTRIATGELRQKDMRFKKLASTVIYLVSPDYAYKSGSSYEFSLDQNIISEYDCRTYFAAAERVLAKDTMFRTVGSSRTVAFGTTDLTPWEARAKIHEAIENGVRGPLQYRDDIADLDYIKSLDS